MARNINSTFALLDVKRGRVELARRINKGEKRIPVTIRGYIIGQFGHDDGISIEFEVEVTDTTERLR